MNETKLEATLRNRLEELGFSEVRRSEELHHVVLRRRELEIVLPSKERSIPNDVARMIVASLQPLLGDDWLHGNAQIADPFEANELLSIDVALLEPGDDNVWRGFALDDLTLIGFGDDRTSALRDLKEAAALKLSVDVEKIVLITPDVI